MRLREACYVHSADGFLRHSKTNMFRMPEGVCRAVVSRVQYIERASMRWEAPSSPTGLRKPNGVKKVKVGNSYICGALLGAFHCLIRGAVVWVTSPRHVEVSPGCY